MPLGPEGVFPNLRDVPRPEFPLGTDKKVAKMFHEGTAYSKLDPIMGISEAALKLNSGKHPYRTKTYKRI